jgi:hemoglobin
MASAHPGMAITEDAFDRAVGHLVATLTGLGVAPDTIGAIGGQIAPLRAQIVSAQLSVNRNEGG